MYTSWITCAAIGFLMLLTSCCQLEEPLPAPLPTEEAMILGRDVRRCACCGGFLITFSTDSAAGLTDAYQWHQLNDVFGISDTLSFPVPVRITYQTDTSMRCGTLGTIDITDLTHI